MMLRIACEHVRTCNLGNLPAPEDPAGTESGRLGVGGLVDQGGHHQEVCQVAHGQIVRVVHLIHCERLFQ